MATAAASFVAFIPVLFDGGPPPPLNDVMNLLAGVSFAACGLVAWRRRPDSAVGRLLTLAGFGILLAPILVQLDSRVAITAAALLGELWIALFAWLILSFVSGGRLESDLDVVLVEAFVFGLLVMQFAVLLFLPDEHNVLLVRPDADVATTLDQGPVRRAGRRVARRRRRHRGPLALGLETAPPGAAAQPGGLPVRRALQPPISRPSSWATPRRWS